MAVTESATCTLKLEYDSGETRNLTFDNMSGTSMAIVKYRVKALNVKLADNTQNAPYRETFISDDGFPITKIAEARYTLTEEEQIYSG